MNLSNSSLVLAQERDLKEIKAQVSNLMSHNIKADIEASRKESRLAIEKMKNQMKVLNSHMESLEQSKNTLDSRIDNIESDLKKFNPKSIEKDVKKAAEVHKIDMQHVNQRILALEEGKRSILGIEESIKKKMEEAKSKYSQLEAALSANLDGHFRAAKADSDRLEAKLDRLEVNQNRLGAKLDRYEVNQNRHEAKLDRHEAKLDRLEAKVNGIDLRLGNIEKFLRPS